MDVEGSWSGAGPLKQTIWTDAEGKEMGPFRQDRGPEPRYGWRERIEVWIGEQRGAGPLRLSDWLPFSPVH